MIESKGHDGETLPEALDRVSDNFEDLGDKHRKSRGRYGWKDLLGGHAFVNVLVTWCREQPRSAGHVWFFQTLATVVVGVGILIWSLL